MAELSIVHNHEDGTRLLGSERGDGVYELVTKLPGWQWRRYAGIHIANSRDRFSWHLPIAMAVTRLEEAGHTVTLQVDDTWRTAAVREEDRTERSETRQERLDERAGKHAAASHAAEQARRDITDHRPFGQPMMPGHHSYPADLRRQARVEQLEQRRFDEADYATELSRRAQAAAANEAYKQASRPIMRRIETLETQRRRLMRYRAYGTDTVAGQRVAAELAQVDEEIAHLRGKLDQRAATGEFVAWGREHFVKGDWAKYQGLGGWYQVTRVNAKSISVAGGGWPPTISWDRVAGRRRNGQQWDTPNGEPWPVELAQRVARWRNLMSYAATAHQHAYDSPERRRADLVGYARRLVHRLPITASGPELQAVDLAGLTIAEQRQLASRYLEVFERLDAGQRVPDLAAWLATLPAAPGHARWAVPTDREPVDRLIATTWTHRQPPPLLQVGDLVVGYRDRGFAGSGQHLVRSFCGPVTAISPVRNRHEAGEFVTVTLDGDEHEFRLPMWVAVHPAGTWEQTAVPAAPATAAEEVVLATPAEVAMLRQVLESLCTDLTRAGEDVHADQIRRMAFGLGHGPDEYAGSVEPASVPTRLRTMPTPAPHRHRFEQAAAHVACHGHGTTLSRFLPR